MKKWFKFTIVFIALIVCGFGIFLVLNNCENDEFFSDEELKLELKDLSIKKGESYDITDFVVSCSGDCTYSYDNFFIGDEVGTYDVFVVAKDKDREIKKSTKLVIIDDIQTGQDINNIPVDEIKEEKQEVPVSIEKTPSTVNKDNSVNNNVNQNNLVPKTNVDNKDENNTVSKIEETVVPKKEETTNKEEVPEVKPVTKVDTVKETSSSNTYRYGTTIINTTTITYDVYSDGSKKEVNRSTNVSYDYSTFNGKTSDLKSEASSLVSSSSDKLNQVVNYTNQYRSEAGVSALKYDSSLSLAATIRALEMGWANKFSHTRPDGRSCFTVLNDLGISYYTSGENIAWGYGSAKTVSEGWKKSSGHYANMVNSSFTKIGVGYASVNGNSYWVQLFG